MHRLACYAFDRSSSFKHQHHGVPFFRMAFDGDTLKLNYTATATMNKGPAMGTIIFH
jgi:hypothetical protein